MRLLAYIGVGLLVLVLLAAGGGVFVFYHFGRGLPDYHQLADYEPPVTTRVHAGDGRLLAEYAIERRVFVPIEAMPRKIVLAFLAAEDATFYEHFGVDLPSVAGAVVRNIRNLLSDRRMVGASTITQQVAKNFLLSNEVSYDRKIKEAILAFRIERALDKDRILELYLNQIYLGFGSYGVAAAALNYFNKSLVELTLGETAMLAALPKAPNNYHPVRHTEAARDRRDWVIAQMLEKGFITGEEARAGRAEPIAVRERAETDTVSADYFTEEVRRWLYERYGEAALYEGGLTVRTTLDPELQAYARHALRDGLLAYDRRHGWRGPLARIDPDADEMTALAGFTRPARMLEDWRIALVREVEAGGAGLLFADGSAGWIPLEEVAWARAWLEGEKLGPEVAHTDDVLASGDIVAVAPRPDLGEGQFDLQQPPEIEGGLVAMDPHTGRVLAIAGGFSFEDSEFNRVTQALRQPGSAFKPFVYLAALDNGFSPADIVLDTPFVIDLGAGLGKWKPENYTQKFYGPSPLRVGIEKSRNLMTVRLSQQISIAKVIDYARRFDVYDDLPRVPAVALGVGETSLLRLATGYAMLVNGGKRIEPYLVDRVQNHEGDTVYRRDERICPDCREVAWQGQGVPVIPDPRPTMVDPRSAYQVVSMLEGVVLRGTGRRIAAVGKPLAGKTGTTNDSIDTWFMGFSPDLVAGVFVGFDTPRSLGARETGSSVAAPIFRDFMMAALADAPATPFRVPPGIHFAPIDAATGEPAQPGTERVILEAFKADQEPNRPGSFVWSSGGGAPDLVAPPAGAGGLY
jgi:penicillin-binding protein 1A